jgi:hypothetical protein
VADQSAHEAVQVRLAALHAELAQGHPELYRHLALYLQVLRDGLLVAVRQACFHLATQIHPLRYGALPANRRRKLQRRLESLVQRTCSLLTVEQLAHLAGELDTERLEQQHERQQRLIQALEERHREQESPPSPQGSVSLGLSLPIGGELVNTDGLATLIPGFGIDQDLDGPTEQESASSTEPDLSELQNRQAVEAMVDAFAEVLGSRTPEASVPGSDGATLLPVEPMLMLRWLAGYEQALARRLRNLSHAINVELLRLGVSNALLPMTLLEAVLQGQLEAQPAPANLLRLPLPFQPEGLGNGGGLEATAVLLRPADLELEMPPLRTCRRRIQQAQQQVRRMARESARLQRRLATLEAEQLWLQDINAASSPTP